MGLATRPPGHLYVSLVFYFAADARGDWSRGVGHGGGGVAASAGAGGAATGAGDIAATGTECGMGTSISPSGSVGAARMGVIHGVSGWCQVTSRE